MNLPWRIARFLVLAAVAVFASQRSSAGFSREMDRAAQRFETSELTRSDPAEPAADGAAVSTNDLDAVADAPNTTQVTTATDPLVAVRFADPGKLGRRGSAQGLVRRAGVCFRGRPRHHGGA